MNGQVPRRAVAGVLVAMALALSACGASSGETGDVDISDVDDPATLAGASEEGATGSGAASGDLCVAVGRVLLAPVLLDENTETITDDEGLDAIGLIAEEVPDEMAADWQEYLDLVERSLTGEGDEPDADQVDRVTQTVIDTFPWGREQCPDLPPAWACPTQSSFEQVGEPVDPPEPADSPEGALHEAEGAVELDRADDTVLFGWLDDDGLVTSTTEVTREGGGWLSTDSSSCR